MTDLPEIFDHDSLDSWLKDQPREVAVTIAMRAAARVAPIWWEWCLTDAAQTHDLTALPVLRCLLISSAAAVSPAQDIRAFAFAAATATAATASAAATATAATASAASAAAASTFSTFSASAAASAAADAAASAAADAAAFSADDAALSAFAAAGEKVDWEAVTLDVHQIADNADLTAVGLWPNGEKPLAETWSMLQKTLADSPDWSFWLRWYQSLLDGTPLSPALIHDIALIDPEIWDKGPSEVAAKIAEIENGQVPTDPTDIQAQLDRRRPPKNKLVQTVQNAMEQNRRELPPTYDALESLILLEMERLQNKNYRDDDDQEECLRQIGVFLTMHAAIVRMREILPEQAPVTDALAVETVSLWQLYKDKLADLPRKKVDEVAEGAWETGKAAAQFGIIAGSTFLATQIGVPPNIGFPVSALVIAPKKAEGIIKLAKDSILPKPG